jgi:hypothetical protein
METGAISTATPGRESCSNSHTPLSHFVDMRNFLGSGVRGEPAKDGWPPGGLRISSGLGRLTGYQEILRVAKMGKRVRP